MPLAIPVLKSLSSRVLSSWIFHLPYKSMNHTKSDQCQNLGSIGLAKKFMRVFLCHLNGMFYRTNFLPNPICVCVYIYSIYAGRQVVKWLNCVQLFETPLTLDYQAPPSMGFSWQESLERVAISFSRRFSQPRD